MESKEQYLNVFKLIGERQIQLENYRQLLNEQIQFNLTDMAFSVNKSNDQFNAFNILNFVNQQSKQYHIESIIKYYNNNTSMNLSFVQFSLMFLSRQHRLLAKMVLERPSLDAMPIYLQNYVKKIIIIEAELHEKLQNFRKMHNMSELIQQLRDQQNFQHVNQQKLKSYCGQLFPAVSQYLRIISGEPVLIDRLKILLTETNCNKIKKFIKEHMKQNNRISQKQKSRYNDPFIRNEFHLLKNKPIYGFSFRQIRSIEKHLQRINSNSKLELQTKIQKFKSFIESQVIKTCMMIQQIILIEKKIQYNRIELNLIDDFYPEIFFKTFDLDRQLCIIPSSMQIYLKSFNIALSIEGIYLFFKKYSNRHDGKLSLQNFTSIFQSTNCNRILKREKIQKLEQISPETKKKFLQFLVHLIKAQSKIQSIKYRYCYKQNINLRDVFSCMDYDNDTYLSVLDFQLTWKKFLNLELTIEDFQFFWRRVSSHQQILKYEDFIYHLTPKHSKKPKSNN